MPSPPRVDAQWDPTLELMEMMLGNFEWSKFCGEVRGYTGFAIIIWNNPKKLDKPCISKVDNIYHFLGLMFSCNFRWLQVDPVKWLVIFIHPMGCLMISVNDHRLGEIPSSQTSSGDSTNSYKVGPEPINGVMGPWKKITKFPGKSPNPTNSFPQRFTNIHTILFS